MSAGTGGRAASGRARDAVEVVREVIRKGGGVRVPHDGAKRELAVLRARLRRVRALAPAFRGVGFSAFVAAVETRGRL